MNTTSTTKRSEEQIRADLAAERDQLTGAVEGLRSELGRATDVAGRIGGRLPALAAGVVGMGFVAGGGVGATMRLVARRSREGHERALFGRWSLRSR